MLKFKKGLIAVAIILSISTGFLCPDSIYSAEISSLRVPLNNYGRPDAVMRETARQSDLEDKEVVAGAWKALTDRKWAEFIGLSAKLIKDGYTIVVVPEKTSIFNPRRLLSKYTTKKLLKAGISMPPEEIKVLEDLDPILPLKKEDSAFNRYNVSALIYAILLPGKVANQKLLLMRRNLDETENLEVLCLSSDPSRFMSMYASLASYIFPLSTGGYPGCDAMMIRANIPLVASAGDEGNTLGVQLIKEMFSGSYARVYLLEKNGHFVIHKEATGRGYQKLAEEITWLRALPPNLSKLFPEIYDSYVGKDKAWMELQFYPWPNISQCIFWGVFSKVKGDLYADSVYMAKDIFLYLLDIYKSLVKDFYKVKVEETPQDFFEKFHRGKIITRLQESVERAPVLKPIINSNTIEIDGRKMLGALPLVELIYRANKETGLLNPPYLSMTHGDLNIDNILIDPFDLAEGSPSPNRKFIDPRGWIGIKSGEFKGQDYMYDFAKLMYHFYGYWELIRRDIHLAWDRTKQDSAFPSFVFQDLFSEVEAEDYNPNILTYEFLRKEFLSFLLKEENFFGLEYDSNKWKSRLLFTMASAMVSDTPFAIKENGGEEQQAKSEYVGGTLLLNEFWDIFIQTIAYEKPQLATTLSSEYGHILNSEVTPRLSDMLAKEAFVSTNL